LWQFNFNGRLGLSAFALLRQTYCQTWSKLVKAGQGWSRLVKAGQGWSRLVKAGQGWSNLKLCPRKRKQAWASIGKHDFFHSLVMRPYPTKSD
jgi:hypothetical protein